MDVLAVFGTCAYCIVQMFAHPFLLQLQDQQVNANICGFHLELLCQLHDAPEQISSMTDIVCIVHVNNSNAPCFLIDESVKTILSNMHKLFFFVY